MTEKRKGELIESERLLEKFRKTLAEQPPKPPRSTAFTDEELEGIGAEKMTDIDGVIFGMGSGSTKLMK